MLFAMLDNLSLAFILVPLALLVIVLSYITGLDSYKTTISILGTTTLSDGVTDPSGKYKIIWGLLLLALALIILIMLSGDILSTILMQFVIVSVPIVKLSIFTILRYNVNCAASWDIAE
jgi:choline-glycine betaine transporter